jgi:O-antigen ligase
LKLERAQIGLVAALAASLPLSIFASEALLVLALAAFGLRLALRHTRLGQTSVDTPLLALAAWSLLSASFAADPAGAHEEAKKLLLFALFYIAVDVLTPEPARERLLASLLLGGLALSALMVVQHHFLGFDRLDNRPPGFLGNCISAAGVTLCVLLLAAARLVAGPRPRPRASDAWLGALVLLGVGAVALLAAAGHPLVATRLFVAGLAALAAVTVLAESQRVRAAEALLPALVLPVAGWALVVSQTRGAWIGGLVGLATVAIVRAPRLLLLGAAAVAALLVLRPAPLRDRLTMADASSVDRYYMWQAGLDMVLERPVFGLGPGMVEVAYPSYRWPEAPQPRAPHLHNNLLQVAAERGLPGLAFFVWWAAALFVATLRALRETAHDPVSGWLPLATLAVLVAIFVAGLFEYNLGDSEVLMVVLLLTAVPFALARARAVAV